MTPDFWKGRSVLVTGHTGFKGSWLALWLRSWGAEVSGFSLPPETTPALFDLMGGSDVASTFGDVRDADALAASLSAGRPEIVFHLAAQSLVRRSYRDPLATYATNVMGTANLLEAVRRAGSVRAVVVVTSDKCYENHGSVWGYRETEPMGGHDPYSSSKGCAELVTSAYRASFFGDPDATCRIASARAGNVIGGGDWSEDRLIPDIIRSFAAHASVEIRSPLATRPWQHVLEPLSGYLTLAERLCGADGHKVAEGWNFGPADSDCKPVSYVVDRLATSWAPPARWHLSQAQHPHEAHLLKVDASKARAVLKWAPRLCLDDAIDWTTSWYQGHLKGQSAREMTLAQIDRYCLRPAV